MVSLWRGQVPAYRDGFFFAVGGFIAALYLGGGILRLAASHSCTGTPLLALIGHEFGPLP
jgi:hypothetical protein